MRGPRRTGKTAIGAAALDKIARLYPQEPSAGLRLKVLMLQGRYEEALALSDVTLRPGAEDTEILHYRIVGLIQLGRAKEAQPSIKVLEAHNNHNRPELSALFAAVDYATEDYGAAVKHAQAATANMTEEGSKNATTGALRLTLVAEARLGNMEQARASLEEFRAAVPEATTIRAIRQWLYPTADLYGFQPLFDGLRLAGLSD